jgi:hypothetical protein
VFLRKSFLFWQKLGFHITLNHFYSPIPDTRTLKEELWSKISDLPGVNINEQKQLALLSSFADTYKIEYDRLPQNDTAVSHEYYVNNGSFESVDGEILYCMIRSFKPKKIYEIGSGYSTYLSAHATLVNKNDEKNGSACELIAFDPYPNQILREGFPGLAKMVSRKIEEISLSEFSSLDCNDILFIDSSHVLRVGSDVQYEYLNILPKLNMGVLVHVHDIFLPAEYPQKWIKTDYRFWNEQYLLQAFLAFNDSFEVLWASSYMHLKHPDKLVKAFASYNREKRWPGSFWMRKIK